MNEAHNRTQSPEPIEIPADLDRAVRSGLRRGRRTLLLRRVGSGTAAALALVFLCANLPVLRTQAAQLPLVGSLVRILQVGSGGSQGDPVRAHVRGEEDRVLIAFTDRRDQSAPVPPFSVVRREVPRRVTLRLHGLDPQFRPELAGVLAAQSGVEQSYPVAAVQEDQQGVTLLLRPGWDCTVGQYDSSLELTFSPREAAPAPARYLLCSAPMPLGPELARMTERLLWEGATQLQTGPEEYRVVLGEFFSLDQARAARQGIWDHAGVLLEPSEFAKGQLTLCNAE